MSDLSGAAEIVAGAGADDGAHEALLQFLYMAPIGLAQLTHQGDVEMMNPTAVNLLMPLAAGPDLDNLFVALADAAPRLRERVAAFAPPNGAVGEPVLMALPWHAAGRPGGDATQHTLSLSLLKLDASRLMAVLRDVTEEVALERQRSDRRVAEASLVDILTHMPNRAAVREYIEAGLQITDGDRHCAVVFINCDRFKQINDGLGYAAGDEVLALLATRLRSALRQGVRMRGHGSRPPLAARLGGDEFAVVLDDLERGDDVHVVAQRILSVLQQPFGIRSHQMQCTVSMGVVLRAQFKGDADAVLQDASIAMVEAKRAGGARYVIFRPELRERAALRADMEKDLRTALAEGQLFVVYQPVVGLGRDGEVDGVDSAAGVEALVRWRHPKRGIVPPLDFIGLAEECGLIGALGRFVLQEACRQFVGWRDALGAAAPRLLAVNLSRGQLDQPGFVESVSDILRDTGMQAAELQLEVTESLAAQDENVQARLHELKALGLTLALDDFGTGYSSLSSLHLLPVDTVKIDRSFVSESVTSSHHRVLIEATVRVANSLRMGIVAEGIETAEQSRVVCELGCGKGQGYLFSRPLPAEELAAWATSRVVARP